MPRLIDVEPFETEVGVTACYVQTTTHTGDGITVKATRTKDIPTIKAVPVEKLGKLGKLMIPYKGCPRGQMGRMCDATLEEETLDMGVITDEDGGRWIPVNEAVLRELIEKAKDRPHGRWRRSGMLIECCYCGEIYSLSGGNDDKDWNACPSCTALMDFKQATCGDCLYVELCETDHSLTEFSRDNPAYCKKFHPKLQHEDG